MNLVFAYLHAILPDKGGTERVAYTVANALKQCGHNVYFMALEATKEDKEQVDSPEHILLDADLPMEARQKQLAEACQQLQIDVIINESGDCGNSDLFTHAAQNGVKIISCLHLDVYGGIKYFHRGKSGSWLKRAIVSTFLLFGIDIQYLRNLRSNRQKFRKTLTSSDAVVVVTPIIAEQLKEFTGICPEKVHSILNPLPFIDCRPQYNVEIKEKLLVYAGRLSHEKNVNRILQAWAQIAPKHPDWKLEIAGTGPLKETLEQYTLKRKIPRVRFLGHVTDIQHLYNRAEYLILASDCESFSCVVLESEACGCHPIVFEYPSASVVIPDAAIGTRVQKHTADALAKAISNAIQSRITNRHIMADVALHMETFNMNKLVREWLALLEKIMSPKQA